MNYLVSRLFGGETGWQFDRVQRNLDNPKAMDLKIGEVTIDYHGVSYWVFIFESGHIYVESEYSVAYAWVYPPEALEHIQGVIDRVAAAPFAERFRPRGSSSGTC